MGIIYRINAPMSAAAFVEICQSSGLRRPVEDLVRIQRMLENANLTLTAWEGDSLVGVARSLTDYGYACYMSDLGVRQGYQGRGIGKELIRRTKEVVGDDCNLLLLATPTAMSYYPHVGFEKSERAWIINRPR